MTFGSQPNIPTNPTLYMSTHTQSDTGYYILEAIRRVLGMREEQFAYPSTEVREAHTCLDEYTHQNRQHIRKSKDQC